MTNPLPPLPKHRWLILLAAVAAASALAACGRTPAVKPPPPPSKHFPQPLFDGLSLGLTRAEVARIHAIRPSLTASGKNYRIWVYERQGEYTVHLSFSDRGEEARLGRIDVHHGRSTEPADRFIARFEATLGAPDVRRRKPEINAYGDRTHRQFETIWSDAEQYVFLTERVPLPGRPGNPVYYLTVRKKQITATGPPTGYVPPPPPVDEEGRPIEEPVF